MEKSTSIAFAFSLFIFAGCDEAKMPLIVNEPAEHFFVSSIPPKDPTKVPDVFADLWSFRFPKEIDLSERGVERYVDALAGGKLTHLFININYQRAYFPSKVFEPLWDSLGESVLRKHAYIRNAKEAYARGLDVYAVMARRCREKDVSPWLSFRMNDLHGIFSDSDPMTSTFWKEHPEYHILGGTKSWKNGFDYAQKPVRDRMSAFIREALERYDVDGIELDFIRFPQYFKPGTEQANAPILTDFMRELRTIADETARRRGHPVRLAARFLPDPEHAVGMGAAVDVWARERLVDAIVVCNMYSTIEYEYHLDDWRKLTGGCVRLIAGTDNGIVDGGRRRILSHAEYRHWMDVVLRAGADGIYFFNFPLRPFCDAAWRGVLEEEK